MDEFKDIGGGVRKQVVKEYGAYGRGTVVPNAFEDDAGGRPGLDGRSYLEPPIDDPSMDNLEDLPASQVRKQSVQSENAGSTRAAKTPVPTERLTAPPVPSLLSGAPPIPTTGTCNKETTVADPTSTPNAPLDINALAALLSNPQLVAQLNNERCAANSVSSPKGALDSGKFTEVIMVGGFGRFRSKVSSVIICENHVALLYTAGAGDDGLAYEPPPEITFILKVPYDDATFREFSVRHFGLVTRIDGIGELVVLPKAGSPDASQAEELDEHD